MTFWAQVEALSQGQVPWSSSRFALKPFKTSFKPHFLLFPFFFFHFLSFSLAFEAVALRKAKARRRRPRVTGPLGRLLRALRP